LDNEGKLSSECKHTIPDADLIKGYETMFVTRLVDDRTTTIQRQGIISTPCSRQFASDGIAPKGEGYGMLTFRVDGNDFFAVHEVVSKAKGHCLEGKGPVLIEAMTHRRGSHGTISISNFGMLGGEGMWATPMISDPEVAILALAKIRKSPVVKGDQIIVRDVLPLSWSFDHRLIDGELAAQISHYFSTLIRDPATIL